MGDIVPPMSTSNGIVRAVGVGLLAWLGGGAIGFAYHATGGRDGFDYWTSAVQRDPFYNGGGLAWASALAVWMLCTAAIRAGAVGGAGAAVSVLGSGVVVAGVLAAPHGNPVPAVLGGGFVAWLVGVAVMAFARSKVDPTAPGAPPAG